MAGDSFGAGRIRALNMSTRVLDLKLIFAVRLCNLSDSSSTRQQSVSRNQASYSVRMMLCLVLSLIVVSLSFRLPIGTADRPFGWGRMGRPLTDMPGLIDVNLKRPEPGMPVTDFGKNAPAPDKLGDDVHKIDTVEPVLQPDSTIAPRMDGLMGLPVLEFADVMPDIAGGIGAYYIRIDYPEEARRKGIQGRLVLLFVVEPDGSTSNVEVLQPLHPLCDSAAVRALRRTSFVPGQQAGRPVRVRMRLPVRFELLDPDSTATVALPNSALRRSSGIINLSAPGGIRKSKQSSGH